MRTAVVIPSMRGSVALQKLIDIAPDNVDFIILSQEKLEKKYERTIEFTDEQIFKTSWIFNRYSKRNFGFLYAYNQRYDTIISVDDDCFPITDSFVEDHNTILNARANDYFNVLKLYDNIPESILEKGPRGFPTSDARRYQIVLNQGLWLGDLDLPASTIGTILKSKNGKIPEPLSSKPSIFNQFVVPKHQLVTICGMNMSFLRELVPAFPYAYMEAEGYGIARYDDIWSGLFIKVILDKLDKRISVGFPLIRHDKGARDVQKDIEYENRGEKMNNFLWEYLPSLVLEGKDYVSCFLEIAAWLSVVADNKDMVFFRKLSKSMYEWVNLIDKGI